MVANLVAERGQADCFGAPMIVEIFALSSPDRFLGLRRGDAIDFELAAGAFTEVSVPTILGDV
ncbi:hypothetical protein [uncultured Jannaschia sp.]|uniref:hypothetical protein n=1 Tax=uncultured Jannaschia sp. TaxID=293347 RepID=UPI002629DB18|nr:hypothetical protein [uncultured Jannaschia sp.]